MRYSGIIYNDFSAAPGVSLSFFTQGCPQPFRCKGCHNPETWDFSGGREFTDKTLDSIINGLQANGIKRNLAIMGGEPLALENLKVTMTVIQRVKETYPDIKIYLWTGYVFKELKQEVQDYLRQNVDVVIDGPYIEEERDITLPMRGSRNQRIINLKQENTNEQ